MAKKIILCFDGTSNDPSDSGDFSEDSSVSNILKMHALFGGNLETRGKGHSNVTGQVSFYYSGIGTYGGWIRRSINAMFAPTYFDMDKIIENAKEELSATYQEGDEIYIFGFSRGAAIARIFASKIKEYCEKVEKVKLLGVFDTVAAIRNSRDLSKETYPASNILFEDGDLGDHIENAIHLVALDEKRLMFQPTLFNKNSRVEEVWFAGAHSDIGGSFWFDGLSDITLKFMLDKCEGLGLIVLSSDDVDYEGFAKTSDDDEMTNDERLCEDDIHIKPMPNGLSHEQKRPYPANKTLAPRRLRVMENNALCDNETPVIHHTVLERFSNVIGYRPTSLRNAKYFVMTEDGKIDRTFRQGISGMIISN